MGKSRSLSIPYKGLVRTEIWKLTILSTFENLISDSTVHGTLLFVKVYMDASNYFPFLLLRDADSAVIVISCQVTKRFIIVKVYLTEFLKTNLTKFAGI